MKKIIAVFISVLVILSLCSCTKKGKTESDASNTISENTDNVSSNENEGNYSSNTSSGSETDKPTSSSVLGGADDKPTVSDPENVYPLEEQPSKKDEIIIEGEKEEITVHEFKNEFYSVWIDNEFFYLPSASDPTFITINGRYDKNGSVSMMIMKNEYDVESGAKRYRNFLKSNYYSVSEIEDANNAEVKGTKHISARTSDEGLKKKLADEAMSVYCVPKGKNESYTIVLRYPTKAAEGYGARLEFMFDSIDFKGN